DRGLAHAALGDTRLAVQDLERYLAHAADAGDAQAIALRVKALRGS
ncbi:MAG: tetratricopeptide repeat protein, partial [Achromobacter sp.]